MSVLKLASHIHSSFSDDSDWQLPRLVAVLRRSGFDGAFICDHDRTMDDDTWARIRSECDRLGDETGFLLVPGIEYQDPDHVVHLPVFGRAPFYGRSPEIGDVVRRARSDGSAAIFAHPRRRDAWRRFDPSWAPHLAGIEVWNRKYDGIRPNAWALRTAREYMIAPTVALDWHGPRQLFPLAIRMAAPLASGNSARSAAIVSAMLAGRMRPTAFGLDIDRFDAGALGTMTRGLEATREWAAPRIRAAESRVRKLL